jgi:haloalkane dehalogenase
MDALRTPDESFRDLPGWPFEPRYVDVPAGDGSDASLRVHYIDEGPVDGPLVLMLHGEPSWSYLYRHMVPIVVDAGMRAVAPDLIGFGRSDKPARRDDYTYQRHVEWMRAALFDELDLRDITLVCQDWGGLIGLRLVAEHPDRFARVVAANTFLPTGADDVIAAYDAPFPDESYKEGARQFPVLVPASPDDPASDANRAAWESLRELKIPFLCAFSDRDPVTAGADRVLRSDIPGAAGQPHTTIEGGGHFLQEDCGPALAKVVVDFVSSS